jgi:hypothetical protein
MPDLRISQLPALSTGLLPNAEIPVSQSGVTYKISASGLATLSFGGGGGSSIVTTNATLTGDGTISNPLSIANPLPALGANGQVLSIVGGNLQWVTPSMGGGGLSVVTTDATLTGDGTIGNPLSIANPLPAGGSSGQFLSTSGWSDTEKITGITVSGTTTKTIALQRNLSLPDLTANLTIPALSIGAGISGDGYTTPLSVTNPLPTGGANGQVLTMSGGSPVWSFVTGNYIPITGTSVGDPVTGNIQLATGTPKSIYMTVGSETALIGLSGAGAEINYFTGGTGAYIQARPSNTATLFARGAASGYTDYGIIATATAANAGSVVLSVANAGELQLKDPNRAVGKVWTCTNGTTGGGTWQTPAAASSITTNTTLTGAGTVGSPLGVTNPLPAATGNTLNTLYSDGTAWQPNIYFRTNGTGSFGMGNGTVLASTMFNVSNSLATNDTTMQVQNTRIGATTETLAMSVSVAANNTAANIGLQVLVANSTGLKYTLRLIDGLEAANKVLRCVDANGHAQWSTAASALTGGTPPTVTGIRGSSAALANLLNTLATLGIIINSTT